MTLQTMVKEYIETLNSPPNAWGQHHHQGTGLPCHMYLTHICKTHGREKTYAALDKAFGRASDV